MLIGVAPAALAVLVTTVVFADTTRWPLAAVLSMSLLFGLLVGALTRAITGGPVGGWRTLVGRTGVALGVGVVVGELAAVAVFAGSIDRQLDQQAAHDADSAPAVVAASADLGRARGARSALDDAVSQARRYRDDALVTARCEYHPSPACPQTRITGVPGAGPEARTAKELLTEAQLELDDAVAERAQQAPALDHEVAAAEQALTAARSGSITAADGGPGARWIALNDYSRSHPGVLLLRLVLIAGCTVLVLLPLIVRLWRGETTRDRRAAARAEVERAEMQAETAVAVKRAELRAAAEILWAEHQLAQARTEVDAAQQHRRVDAELGDVIELPAPQLPAATAHLPARVDPDEIAQRETSPAIPEMARAATRWIRPLVPPVIARVVDTATRPVRSMRQAFEGAFEEVEEITFALKRTHRVNVHSAAAVDQREDRRVDVRTPPRRLDRASAEDADPVLIEGDQRSELGEQQNLRELPPS